METTTITVNKQRTKDTAVRVLSVVGGIAVLAGVVWVGMQGFRVLPNARETLANAFVSVQSFFSPAERIVLSLVDSQAVVEEPFTISWEHRGKTTDGSYSFFYGCSDDVHLALADDTVFCNTELPILSTDTSLRLTAYGDIVGVTAIPVEVRFRENDETVISERGELTIAIQDVRLDDATSTSTEPTATTTPVTPVTSSTGSPQAGVPQYITTTTGPVSDPNGKADFTVRVIAYGLVDKNSGAFTEKDEIPRDLPSNKRGAIKFVVENVGTKLSGEWVFEAALPTSPSYTYKSKDQDSLYPGDKIEFIIGFDKIKNADEDDYRIEVDSKDEVNESNENNNVKTGEIEIDR